MCVYLHIYTCTDHNEENTRLSWVTSNQVEGSRFSVVLPHINIVSLNKNMCQWISIITSVFLLPHHSLLCKTMPRKTCELCTNPLALHLVNLTQIHISPRVAKGTVFLLKPRVTETTDLPMYFGSREEK